MAWTYKEISSHEDDGNVCRILEPSDFDEWIKEIAHDYVNLRADFALPLQGPISVQGIGVLDTTFIQKKIAELTVPKSDLVKKKALSITRADFGEVASYNALQREYATCFGYQSVRDRETIQLPGRNIDGIGAEDVLNIILNETKFSDEADSPPQVVQKKKDSLKKQHIHHIKNLDETASKLAVAATKARDRKAQEILIQAALLLDDKKYQAVGITCASVLIRPSDKSKDTDFGIFKDLKKKLKPANSRFLLIRSPKPYDATMSAFQNAVEAVLSA